MKSKSPKLVGITQGANQPSTRFRWSQYVGELEKDGFEVTELASYFGAYAPASRMLRPMWLGASIAENAVRTFRASQYDLCFLQRNLTATLCTWEPLLHAPFVFDVDDALFLGPRGESADRIARSASLTICGNNFLANHFSRFGPVAVLPTAVDTTRFVPRTFQAITRPVIGWSGSSSGFKYLYRIEPALKKLLRMHPEAIFKVVADKAPIFRTLPLNQLLFEQWSAKREIAVLHEYTVGIMPLEDDLWARGKCSFKMLTYMAAGLPVVVSPVGMNIEILDHGPCGMAAKTEDDWVDAISCLLHAPALANRMGQEGRQIIENHYARNVIAPQLSQLLRGEI